MEFIENGDAVSLSDGVAFIGRFVFYPSLNRIECLDERERFESTARAGGWFVGQFLRVRTEAFEDIYELSSGMGEATQPDEVKVMGSTVVPTIPIRLQGAFKALE